VVFFSWIEAEGVNLMIESMVEGLFDIEVMSGEVENEIMVEIERIVEEMIDIEVIGGY